MRIKPITYAIAAMILIETNFLIYSIANVDDLQKLTPETVLSTNSKSTSNIPDIQPLPWKTFTEELSDLLSPDIFSMENPFTHLLINVIKLPYDTMNRIMDQMLASLWYKKFPQQYIPYAELVTSIITCLGQLERVKKITPLLQNLNQTDYLYKPLDILVSAIDPELSPLFSSYILSDKNPPFRVLIISITIPENNIPSIKIHLRDLFKNRLFPRRYFGYAKCLQVFLGQPHLLQHLKKHIAEVQPTLMDSLSTQTNGTWEDIEFGLKSYDPLNSDSTLTSQHLKQVIADLPNNNQAGNFQSGKTVSSDVMKFLSPRMFSTADPVTYVLNKVRKLNLFTIRHINSLLTYHLDNYEFPQEYIPYAELASSILSCLCELGVANEDIKGIRHNIIGNRIPKQNDIFIPDDPELSKLFSTQIMSKVLNPSINILRIFIDIPENEISNLPTRLKIIQDDDRFPQQYRDYNTHLKKFLEDNQCLLRIKDEIAEIRRILMFNSSNSNNQQTL